MSASSSNHGLRAYLTLEDNPLVWERQGRVDLIVRCVSVCLSVGVPRLARFAWDYLRRLTGRYCPEVSSVNHGRQRWMFGQTGFVRFALSIALFSALNRHNFYSDTSQLAMAMAESMQHGSSQPQSQSSTILNSGRASISNIHDCLNISFMFCRILN